MNIFWFDKMHAPAVVDQTGKDLTWVIVGLATFLAWLPTLWGGFLHDDYILVEKGISASIQAGRVGRMAAVFIFQSTKNMPALYHLFVVSIHCINSILIFLIADQLLHKRKASLSIAIAFSISYLVTDAVF